MGYPMPPNWPPPPPAPVHRNSTDVTISVVVLAMTALASELYLQAVLSA